MKFIKLNTKYEKIINTSLSEHIGFSINEYNEDYSNGVVIIQWNSGKVSELPYNDKEAYFKDKERVEKILIGDND